jgi:hypothetical protein
LCIFSTEINVRTLMRKLHEKLTPLITRGCPENLEPICMYYDHNNLS